MILYGIMWYNIISNYSVPSYLFRFVLVEFKIPNNGFANNPTDPVTDPSMNPFTPDVLSPANGSKQNPKIPKNKF